MTWLASMFGVGLFTLLFGASFYCWDLFRKWKSRKNEPSKEERELNEVDLQKLIDAQKEKDYSRGSDIKYDWTQNEHEIEMHIKIPTDQEFSAEQISNLTKKDVTCTIRSDSINQSGSNSNNMINDYNTTIMSCNGSSS